jgi:hypothetical protein
MSAQIERKNLHASKKKVIDYEIGNALYDTY